MKEITLTVKLVLYDNDMNRDDFTRLGLEKFKEMTANTIASILKENCEDEDQDIWSPDIEVKVADESI